MTSQGLTLFNRLAYVAIVVGAFFAGANFQDEQDAYNLGYFHGGCEALNTALDRPLRPACAKWIDKLEGGL